MHLKYGFRSKNEVCLSFCFAADTLTALEQQRNLRWI